MATNIASIERLDGLRSRTIVRHTPVLVAVAAIVVALETSVPALDHGTHLLVALTAVVGTAVLLGPRPAVTGLATGAVVAAAASVVGFGGALHASNATVQLAAYLVVGGSAIALVAPAIRSGARRAVAARAAPPLSDAPPALPDRVSPGPAETREMVEALTPREAEILRLAASGIPVEEMARGLCVSSNTVKTHLTHIYAKLGVRGRAAAVRAALHCGWLTPADICPHQFVHRENESPVRMTTPAIEARMIGRSHAGARRLVGPIAGGR